jgi:Spy/CpxP family protein refolding chaperone
LNIYHSLDVWSKNMNSIRKVVAGTLLASGALLSAAAGLSWASAADTTTTTAPPAGPHGWGGGPHGWGPGRMYSKLGLSTEQQASIKAIMTAAKPTMKSMHEQMRANHQKLEQTLPTDPNYASVVAEVAQSNATLASQRTTQMSEIRSQIYAVLTPAQQTQLAALKAQWAANPHQGPWGHRGPPPGSEPPPDGE